MSATENRKTEAGDSSTAGLLIIDKPAGLTSHDVVSRVRRALRQKRVGHTGTLDPFATGVLVVLVGRATRLAQFLGAAEKEYEAVIRFGFATDTGDATGTPRPESIEPAEVGPCRWTDDEIEAALAGLRGERRQVPPMYSAKKMQGRKLYELARRGLEVEREPVPVTIHELEAVSDGPRLLRQNESGACDLPVRVVCSAGTYIRVLAEEIGERLGVGAHLVSLRRTRAGEFRIEEAIGLEELQGGNGRAHLLPPEAALSFMPFVHLSEREAGRARQGMAVQLAPSVEVEWSDRDYVRLHDERGSLVAVALYDRATRSLRPRVVLAP